MCTWCCAARGKREAPAPYEPLNQDWNVIRVVMFFLCVCTHLDGKQLNLSRRRLTSRVGAIGAKPSIRNHRNEVLARHAVPLHGTCAGIYREKQSPNLALAPIVNIA